jgi:hypothetical protein
MSNATVNSQGDVLLLETVSFEHSATGVPTQLIPVSVQQGQAFAGVLVVRSDGQKERLSLPLTSTETEILRQLQHRLAMRID